MEHAVNHSSKSGHVGAQCTKARFGVSFDAPKNHANQSVVAGFDALRGGGPELFSDLVATGHNVVAKRRVTGS